MNEGYHVILLDALQTEDYPRATELAMISSKAEIHQALQDSFFLQNLQRHWQAVELFILLEQRNIVSLSLGHNKTNSETVTIDKPSLPAELLAILGQEAPTPTDPVYPVGQELLQYMFNALQHQPEQRPETLRQLSTLLPKIAGLNTNHGELLRDAIRRQLPLTVIELLLDVGCSPFEQARDGANYLMQIVQSVAITDDQFASFMAFFLAQGLDINHPNLYHDTPLSIAASLGNRDKVALLLDLGADADMLFRNNADLLEIALYSKQLKVIELLQQRGMHFDFDKLDRQQQSLLYRFLKNPCDIDLTLLALLLKDKPDLYQINRDLYRQRKQTTPMQRLLDHSPAALQLALHMLQPDLNQTDSDGNTALHLAAGNYVNYEQQRADDILSRVKLLISYGADVTLCNNQEQTPAEMASDDDLKIDIVRWLRQQEANV